MPEPNHPVQAFEIVDDQLTGQAIDAYNTDGVVCLRRAVTADWLAVIEEGIAHAISGASIDHDVVQKADDKGKFSISSQAWRNVEPFRRFIFDSPISDLSMQVLQSQTLTLLYDFLLIKEANSDHAATPWHQDHSYYPLIGQKVINCWTALDPIPVETALKFVKSSHLPGTIYRAANFEDPNTPYIHARDNHPPMPDVDNDPQAEILSTAMAPGDVLIFNSRTLHSAPGNMLDRRRAGFSLNWVGDDVTYLDVPSLETYLDPTLKTGDPIMGDKFPQVRRRVANVSAS